MRAFPITVGIAATGEALAGFDSMDMAVAYVGTLDDHKDGIYYIDAEESVCTGYYAFGHLNHDGDTCPIHEG